MDVEEEEEEEEEKEEEQPPAIASSIWNQSIALLQPLDLPTLVFDEDDDEAAEGRIVSEEEFESEQEEEEEEKKQPPTAQKEAAKELTDADIDFTPLPLSSDFKLPELTYGDSNGAADSLYYHELWWTEPADFESLVIQNPRRISDRTDVQFEAMVRLAEVAPRFVKKNDPGSLPAFIKRKVSQNEVEMVEIASAAHERVQRKVTRPARVGRIAFDLNSIKLLRLRAGGLDAGSARALFNYHKPQTSRKYDRSFLQSLDRQLSRLRGVIVKQPLTEETALEQLFLYADEMLLLSVVSELVIDPQFVPLSEVVDPSPTRSWKKHWNAILKLQDRPKAKQLLIDLDAVGRDSVWWPIQNKLEASAGAMDQELWEEIVLTAAITASMPWSGSYWSKEQSELLLSYLNMILSILQSYSDVIEGIEAGVEADIERGLLDERDREAEVQRRVNTRVRPFVIALRIQPYTVPDSELLTEIVLNGFYGVERGADGLISQITQQVDGESEAMRLLPRYQPEQGISAQVVEEAAAAGVTSFDVNNYSAGSYNYVNKVMISQTQADVLGSSGLDQKVLSFRGQLIEALQHYRQVTMRAAFLSEQSLPPLTGHDINFILCRVASYISSARNVDIAGVLRAAVKALPKLKSESRRSKRVSEFLFYYALAVKLFLFEDGYLEQPRREIKQQQQQLATRKAASKFLDIAAVAEDEDEDEDDDEKLISLKERQAVMEKRILRVASSLYAPNNVLSRWDASTEPTKTSIISQGSLLRLNQYMVGVNEIWSSTSSLLSKYREAWLAVGDNEELLDRGSWRVGDVTLKDEAIVNAIPFVRDTRKIMDVSLQGLQDSFYSAVSVRELMERGRQAIAAAPAELSQPYPLIVAASQSVNAKLRGFQVAQQFLVSGYIIPSTVDSLATGFTVIQLLRVLKQNAPVSMSTDAMILLITRLLTSSFLPEQILLDRQQSSIACRLMYSCMTGQADDFRDMLYYASIQDIRVAGMLTLQIDYWLPSDDAKAVVEDIKTDIVSSLIRKLLGDDSAAIDRYNSSIEQLNESLRRKRYDPLPLLQAPNNYDVLDYMTEADYSTLSISESLLEQITASPPAVIYTPWLSIQQAVRMYVQFIGEQEDGIMQSICAFIDEAAGDALATSYIRSECGREVVIDVRKDDMLSKQTFMLLQQHSLLYDGEDYDTRLEAVLAYFAMKADVLLLLDKLDSRRLLSTNQQLLWERLKTAAGDAIIDSPNRDRGVILEQITADLSMRDQRSLISILETLTGSNLRDLQIQSDGKLHQSRAASKQPYTGYIFMHEKTGADGVISTVFTPVYPKYRRLLKRLLQDIKDSLKEPQQHWLDVWEAQYRPRVIIRMAKSDEEWKPVAEHVSPALSMRHNIGEDAFLDAKQMLSEPPLRPRKISTEFSGFAVESPQLRLRSVLLLLSHIMEVPVDKAPLTLLVFVIPDARTSSVYDIVSFVDHLQIIEGIGLLDHLLNDVSVESYVKQHSPEQTAQEAAAYADTITALLRDAKTDIDQGRMNSSNVKTAALLFDVDTKDPNLLTQDFIEDIDNGLSAVNELQGFLVALRYPFTHDGQTVINTSILDELFTSVTEPLTFTKQLGIYRGAFLRKKAAMTIPGPMKVLRPEPEREKEEERERKRRRVAVEEEEESENEALKELLRLAAS